MLKYFTICPRHRLVWT